ncbi:MAG: hypothetical protein HQM16_07625 [Deltaproteobacteria bacterium]|nr:hypothetical protein [Deltaproteobacteria bacterium]
MSEITVQAVADAMLALVTEYAGKKKLKPMDLTKAMREKFGDACEKQVCKDALKTLIESGKCVYTYFGGSFVELPHIEGAAR